MFDSLLNSKFYNKCKHAIKCIHTRLNPILRKKQAMLRFLKQDIADLLANGLDSHAFGRIDGLIVEMNHASCYDMIEQWCEYILKQLNSLQKQSRECPQEAMEAVSTLIFAAARFPDLPELCDLRQIFRQRYGNFIESFVSPEFVQKLQDKSFSTEEKLQVMQNIAEEFSVGFDTKALQRKLFAAPETKHDLPQKSSFKRVEGAVPVFNRHKEDANASCEITSKATPADEQTQSMQLKPKDILVIPNSIGQVHDKGRRLHSDKPDDMEHSDNLVSPFGMNQRNGKKEVNKDDRPCKRELMEAVELDLNGQRKHGTGPVKSLEAEVDRTVLPYTNPKEAEKNDCIEKENVKDLSRHQRPRKAGDHVALNGKTVNKAPPYTKLTGARSEAPAEEENNGFLHGGPENLAEPGRPAQDGHRAAERAANRRPPYVKPKANMQPIHAAPANQNADDHHKQNVTEQRDGLVDGEVLPPVSVRRKFAEPPAPTPVDSYEEAPNDEKIAGRTPRSRRRPMSRRNGSSYDDDYDGVMHHLGEEDDDTDDYAIDFGNLLPRPASGHRRHKNRNADARNGDDGDDEEERMMDRLLMHYSKKGLHREEARTRTRAEGKAVHGGSVNPPDRAVSLPTVTEGPDDELKAPARTTSMQPDMSGAKGGRVHPRMPDYDELAARINALRKAC